MSQGGFTKLEILLVSGVLVIVLAISFWMVGTARANSRDALRLSDIAQIQAGLELHYADQFTYPVSEKLLTLGNANTACLGSQGFANKCGGNGATYMPMIPTNVSGAFYQYKSLNAEDGACAAVPCVSYAIQFALEQPHGSLVKGLNCARPTGILAGGCK